MRCIPRSGFTIIELLVVVSIVVLLMSLLLPALGHAKESARRSRCSAQQKQMMYASLHYASTQNEHLPFGTTGTPTVIGGGDLLHELAGGKDSFLKLGACPSHEKLTVNDRPFFTAVNAYGVPAGGNFVTYLWAGGAGHLGNVGPASHDGTNFWHGWYTYGSARFNLYEDRQQLGPAMRIGDRSRTSDTALLLDRMWPGATTKWTDTVGHVLPNHRGVGGVAEGGNAAYMDGHVRWRAVGQIQQRVSAYAGYNPYFCY